MSETKLEYHRRKSKEWYERNKERHKANVDKNRKVYRDRNYKFLYDYLLTHPCTDCGEADIVVLELDHLRDKICAVAKMLSDQVSLKTLENEISKCEVVCCNCHRRRTARRAGWRRALAGGSGLEPSKLDG